MDTLLAVAVVIATLLGPVLAVWNQRRIDRERATRDRKERVFEVLMATRNSYMSVEHVRALNMIEVSFYGKGPGHRQSTEDEVISAWRYYLSFLNEVGQATQPATSNAMHSSPTPEQGARRDDLFVALLESIAKDLGYNFDRASLKPTGGYSPAAHVDDDRRARRLTAAALDLLEGNGVLPVAVIETHPGTPDHSL
jgi:hypothetical protein